MARPGRPASESYQPVCCSVGQSVSYSSAAGTEGLEDEDDRAPIFSLSKSSMDVLMATGPPHNRDPAWTRMDLRRSASTNTNTNTNTHSEQTSVMLQQLHPHMWQHVNNLQLPLAAQHVDAFSPPAVNEHWFANMQRWSMDSGSTHSRSSTPDTVVWKERSSRPCSLTQETPCSSAPLSPISKANSPPITPSLFISPLQTPTLPPVDLLTSSFPLTLSAHQQGDSPTTSPPQAHNASPLPSNSSNLLRLTGTDDEGLLENNLLSFQYPSPIPSSVSLEEAGESSDPGGTVDDMIEELPSSEGTPLYEDEGARSRVQMSSDLTPNSAAEGQESGRGASVCRFQLPWQPGRRGWMVPLVSSLSDSQLHECCTCDFNSREGITQVDMFMEEGTMTSRLELVDAAVQTVSPTGSWWNLRRNMSSNMGSHSILGSPPGSRLNLKVSMGSHSNLVSPSSSMFPVSSGEEEERRGDNPTWDVNCVSSHVLERRRSILKTQSDERGEPERRSSIKQVQWDEDGMTWDVHGASLDPVELSTAIRKHLELQNSPRPTKRPSKKKKAPKPPLISSVVKAMAPELNPPVMIIRSTCMLEGESEGEEKQEIDGGTETVEEGGGKKDEVTVEAARKISRAEGENAKEEEEVYREEGTSYPKSPSRGSGHSRKRSVFRSLRRPGWCGSSRLAED